MVSRAKRAGGIVYKARFKDPDGKWQDELVGPNKREAERVEAQRKREVAAGTYSPKGNTSALTLAGFSERWLKSRRNKTKSDDIQRIRDHVLPKLGTVKMRDLRLAQCVAFVRGLVADGVNPKTVSNVWGALRTLLRDAEIEELISFHPSMPKGIIPQRQTGIEEIYPGEDVAKLTMGDMCRERVLWALAFYTGMRQGEFSGLRWSDWDSGDDERLGSLTVRRQYDGSGDDASTKTGRARVVPVHPQLVHVLLLWGASYSSLVGRSPKADDPIVPTREGQHYSKSQGYKALRRHAEAVGVKFLGVHRTRHTAITAMRRGGATQADVERVTHNASGTIVDRYTHDWTILSRVVSGVDYSSRVVSRVGLLIPSSDLVEAPGIEPGREIGKSENNRDKSGQSRLLESANFPSSPQSDAARDARRENLHVAAGAALEAWYAWLSDSPRLDGDCPRFAALLNAMEALDTEASR